MIIVKEKKSVPHAKVSWQKEPVSEDLEEAAWFYADRKACLDKSVFTQKEVNEKRSKLEYNWEDIRIAFKAGAQWQKEQMLKDMLLGYVCFNQTAHSEQLPDHCIITDEETKEIFDKRGLKEGDRVKVIIIKDE